MTVAQKVLAIAVAFGFEYQNMLRCESEDIDRDGGRCLLGADHEGPHMGEHSAWEDY